MMRQDEERKRFLLSIGKMSGRVRIATRNKTIAAAARSDGVRVIDHVRDLRHVLEDHPKLQEALRAFLPHIWRQELRSRLQAMGVLTLPKLRIWILIIVSIILFGFVFLRLLPSATITVTPREDTISQTANIFLVGSGSLVELPERVKTMELIPLIAEVSRTITFDQISKEFIGENASVMMTIINKSDEQYGFLNRSRLVNQAGMVFRIQESVYIDPGEEVTLLAIADAEDLYREIIGDRGNVPEGLKWDFVGLTNEEQNLVYAINKKEATGGVTDHETVLKKADLAVAERQLKNELLGIVSQMVDEDIQLYNDQHPGKVLTRLYYDELTKYAFTGFTMPTQFLGEKVTSVPVEGSVIFTAYGYDEQYILTLLNEELITHVEEGKHLLPESVRLERLVTHVIDYEDDLSWIKLTVDLSGTQQAVLGPLTPTGARFGKTVRELVLGKTPMEARRIVRNFPEVEQTKVSLWPPWSKTLPNIPYHISIEVDS